MQLQHGYGWGMGRSRKACFANSIEEKDYGILKELISKTRYQIDRYIDSLYKLEKEGKWKSRFKRNR